MCAQSYSVPRYPRPLLYTTRLHETSYPYVVTDHGFIPVVNTQPSSQFETFNTAANRSVVYSPYLTGNRNYNTLLYYIAISKLTLVLLQVRH